MIMVGMLGLSAVARPAAAESLGLWTYPKATQRDGTPNGGSVLPGGYILLNPKKLYWKY